jgi:2',3'-cyclic-nucleotide 2'-phosphodiesterase (5'-nucleotidase family)
MVDWGKVLRTISLIVSLAIVGFGVASLRFRISAQSSSEVHLTLLGTTDLHGQIEPLDYYSNRPAQIGLAKIATLIKRVRAERANVLLLDSGDTIQGTSMAYYFAQKANDRTNPMIAAMNDLAYDAAAVGNHEFDFGLAELWKVKREAHFPILAANIKQTYSRGPQHFEPYIVKTISGVRVAIVGFVTPSAPRGEIPENYRGYQFEPIVEAARRVIPEVRKQVDVVIVLSHSGLPPVPAWSDDRPGDNAALELAQQVPGIDVILLGHTHNQIAERTINGVLLTQAGTLGAALARVDLDLSRKADGHWQIKDKHSAIIPVSEQVHPDPQIIDLIAPYERATQAYLDTRVATSGQELRAETARFEEEPLLDLIHAVQMELGHADISLATLFNTGAHIPEGKVTVRDVASLYVYEYYLYTIEMTGARLRAALEHAASLYQSWPLPSGEQCRLPDLNVDSAAGVTYSIDLRQPPGHRIAQLKYKGQPLSDSRKLRVAMSNARYFGGGGYDFHGLPIVYRSTKEIRELILEHVTHTGLIPTSTYHSWQVEPREALDALRRAAYLSTINPRHFSRPSRGETDLLCETGTQFRVEVRN